VGLRAEDSVTGQGRLRLLLVEEVSSISSEFCSAALSRSRERKAENMVKVLKMKNPLDIGGV
jgi:hypothetical protein